ncbi:MAG: hypothetical protein F6K47_20665 [Symploca sp. SIO2E6]|nr:hypothetical protein [Symploca sp. SIO2E6]
MIPFNIEENTDLYVTEFNTLIKLKPTPYWLSTTNLSGMGREDLEDKEDKEDGDREKIYYTILGMPR